MQPPAEAERRTLADLIERLGGVSPERILLEPPPGTATEADLVKHKLCELIDGVLVEKAVGWEESAWGALLIGFLEKHLAEQRIAIVTNADGLTRLVPGRVRAPDVAVYLLSRFPGGKAKPAAICALPPDWAIEIRSRSNTKRELQLKREEYFAAGVRRVWIVDPRQRTIEEWTGLDQHRVLAAGDVADLNDILPGFTLKPADWFSAVDAVLDTTEESE